MGAGPTISSVRPLRAVEGGRVTIHGSAFPSDRLQTIPLGDTPARVAFASSSRLVLTVPEDLEGGPTPVKIPGAPGETVFVSRGREVGDRTAPGRQPRFRRPGQPVRHLQRLARAGSAGLDFSGHPRRHARAVRVGHRQCHVDGDRPRRASLRLEPVRGRRLPDRRGGCARAGGVGSRRRVRDRVRPGRIDVRRRPVGHDLPGARRAGVGVCRHPGERRGVSPGDERRIRSCS